MEISIEEKDAHFIWQNEKGAWIEASERVEYLGNFSFSVKVNERGRSMVLASLKNYVQRVLLIDRHTEKVWLAMEVMSPGGLMMRSGESNVSLQNGWPYNYANQVCMIMSIVGQVTLAHSQKIQKCNERV